MGWQCWFSPHRWEYVGTKRQHSLARVCRKCSRHERASYDMSYGTTTWWHIRR
ncbi:hypothetical protein LCGC14_2560080 [marine sediment metagenome]|uniref:Uncharacterized protein n=1 Tax=marine sediment metagenome TaxID=412755 RepID=A0A0F9AK92_9ZZZZ